MASMLRMYNAQLLRRPMLTQCLTAAVLFGAGDVLAQQAIEKKGMNHDIPRTARLSLYGGAMFGPIITKWYQLLNRLKFASPVRGVIYKVWLDQAILTPGIVVLFFSSLTFMEGKGVEEAKKRVEMAYVPTLIRNWGVFVPAQLINFWVVPHHLRFVFVSVVSLFWNTYLSYANQQAQSLVGAAETKSQAKAIEEKA